VRRTLDFARSEAAALAALALIAAATLVFIDVADDSAEEKGRAFDMKVLEWLHPYADHAEPRGPAWFDHAVRDLTSLGSVAVLAAIVLIVFGYLALQRRRLEAASLAVSLGGGLMLSETLKQVFERDRPPFEWHATDALNASFPSGHALLSTVVYLSLGAMLARAVRTRTMKAYVMGVAVVLALAVGASRVYLGVHWASDVLGGWSLGAAWATLCWLAERAIARRLKRARERAAGQAQPQASEAADAR
jgi:undecaprenyl-diphosphatase